MSLIGYPGAEGTENYMTTAVAGLIPEILMMVGSTIKTKVVTKKYRVKDELVEPERNWAELNPNFDVPHREYE